MPARDKWWDDVVKSDTARYYSTAAKAKSDDGGKPPSGQRGTFIWGDRVRVLQTDGDVKRISGRGGTNWVNKRHLGGEALLEVYIIDVGQGDGLLVVTPEGHHVMVDGGNIRKNQQGGKNAADFVDWKFARDYVNFKDRDNVEKTKIRLDAMIASHNDLDHFGGLWDLIDQDEKNLKELDAGGVTIETVYHAGLSWWFNGHTASGKTKRSLGTVSNGNYTKLLTNRSSALAATANLANPDFDTLNGSWGKFIAAATQCKRNSGAPSRIDRISDKTGKFLPGFGPGGDSDCQMRVLGPIESDVSGQPGLKRFPDGTSKNTNGHSIVLRLDYGDRRILLTGDLNTHSQNHIMETFGSNFTTEYRCDVAKGCHHGSHDVSYKFLDGLRPLVTVISSGDAETHDHPRPTIVAASALTGRRLLEGDHLVAPMVYMTEVARSVGITKIGQMNEYSEPQPKYERKRPVGAKKVHNTKDEMAHYRLFLGSSQSSSFDWPRLDTVKAVSGIRYGLINVRTDGKRIFTAQLEESGGDWAYHVLNEQQITDAR
ncbi:hypothetical protein [Tateyamaria sp. ANG-S1]|uniref:ComEC/Rec2 family competence protein n=1 Tax=Tateyamaria sp. ANG-S1 TaxID=1577905 RepID=UPI00126A4F05|nr:hypothetical protein [Tateyamaria sp. ANG-S1]